jgi:peptidoglycan/LPS O-acetylase OafA/YrhL
MENIKSTQKLEIIEILRGLASLAVVWFHFTNGNPEFLDEGWVKLSGKYGWIGVEMFFVISGFIIPYSLWRSNFKLNLHWKKYLIKRAIRIYPAYLITILLIILLCYASVVVKNFQGDSQAITFLNLFLHMGFLNGIFNQDWLNTSFWTLGIEFQYYFLIILVYPLLVSTNLILKLLFLSTSCVLPFVFPQENLIFNWLLLFNFGILAFQFMAKKISLFQYLTLTIFVTFVAYFNKDFLIALAGFLTSTMIVFINSPKIRILEFLGELSYSLYLLHGVIGVRVITLGYRVGNSFYIKILSISIALAVSIFAAYLMYRYIEKPALKYFRHIKYNT